jgi:uroporphyrinogen III methyltransferase/synthase
MGLGSGKVYLVGAGPGDPKLITLRGAECLGLADVVLYDYLASPLLLSHARPGAELTCLGRHGHGRLLTPAEVIAAILAHAAAGRVVVRLKCGDPAIFAHLSEELAALEAAQVPYEIVPGVTAAQIASSHAGIPLTHRDVASCVALVAGQEAPDKDTAERLDYAALAAFPGTLVFYMGITTARDWSAQLIEHGKSPDTPVAVVRRGSFPDQQTLRTTLGDLPQALQQGTEKLRPPAVVIVGSVVGNVASQSTAANWFTSRPLFGRTVLVTRPGDAAGRSPGDDDLAARLRDSGANVLHQPAILVREPADWSSVDAAIERLDEFDWLVFTSANGDSFFLLRLFLLGIEIRALGR